jgi:two-component system chemotaxis sensor kinase CheA
VSFFSEERASELRELFFESAQELLQALNEAGLELEKRPSDTEIIRTIRRTVHTLKGDSAACGFRELSELAHQFEDVLTPEIAARNDDSVAQVVLSAADAFDAMLAAYRNKLQLPDETALRELIRGIARGSTAGGTEPNAQPSESAVPAPPGASPGRAACDGNTAAPSYEPRFLWSEYEELVIQQGSDGRPLFNVGVGIDPQCPFRAAGVQLVRTVLQQCGKVLIVVPEEGAAADKIETVEAVLASDHDAQWIAQKCRIPAVVSGVVIRPFVAGAGAAASGVADPQMPGPKAEPSGSAPLAASAEGANEALSSEKDAEPAPAVVEELPASAPALSENILRVDAGRIDTVLNLVGELIIGKSMLHQAITEFGRRFPKDPLRGKFADMLARQTQVLNELQRSVMKIRMVPVEQLFRRFPRVVRDLAKITGKSVNLEVSGQDTDLDKSILDALAEPLTHLVRNAVDHGLEPAEERVAAGKPAQGTVRLHAFHQGNQVVVEISDDGRGIDREKVAAKALESGLVTGEDLEHMTEGEVLELIFEPGFSTAKQVTELSGRGVGLDVVRIVLERMKGTVALHTRPGAGTTFQLKVPLTLAIIKALLFRVNERLYAVPLGAVLEITRASESDVHHVDHHEVLKLRGQVLTLVRLGRMGGKPGAPRKGKKVFVIVVAIAGRKFGLVVDRVVGEEELVIKALDHQLVASEVVSGASILGDGTVVLILNIAAAVEKLGRIRGVSVEAASDPEQAQLQSAPEPGTASSPRDAMRANA